MEVRCQNILLVVLMFFLLPACVMEEGGYHDSRVYSNAISEKEQLKKNGAEAIIRNPIIVINGLLGAQLQDTVTGETVWGVFSPAALRSGKFNRQLMHPAGFGTPLNELAGSVLPDGLLARSEIQLMGVSFYLSNYEILLEYLSRAGFISEDNVAEGEMPTQFIFAYDWRRDISENAVELHKFITAKKKMLQSDYRQRFGISDYDVQFDIVAHSMGGLLAGYYLRYGGIRFPDDPEADFPVTWAGGKNVDKVVMIGTPNAGYIDAMLEICNGLKLTAYAPVIPPAVIGSFPSLYQMMPDPDTGTIVWQDQASPEPDIWDVALWEKFGWGLAGNIDHDLVKLLPEIKTPEERRAIAIDHLKKCLLRGKLFRKYMRRQAPPPPEDVKIFLIAGDALKTNSTISIDGSGIIRVTAQDSGDGKITCSSARYDLVNGGGRTPFSRTPIPWYGICYLPGGHMGIMNSTVFLSNLTSILFSWPSDKQLKALERLQ